MKSTDTVKNFFGLHKMPFSKLIGVNELYHSSSFKEAFARLQMGLENEDVVLLSGAVGSGKSNVLRYFTHSLDPNAYCSIYIAADTFKIRAMIQKSVDQGAGSVPRRRMNDKTRRLVHHDKILVFE